MKKVMLRVVCTEEEATALLQEWLHGSAVLKVSTGDRDMEVALTYVNEVGSL